MKMRYSLKTLLVVVTVIALLIVVGLYVTEDYRERMALQADLLSTTGAHFVSVNADYRIVILFTKPVETSEIKKYKKIDSIELQGFAVTSDSTVNLSQLDSVDVMLFQSCMIPDSRALKPLTEIGSIRSLLFWNTAIDDSAIDLIANVTGLDIVDFKKTKVTQAGLDRLRSTRPEIRVFSRP